MKIYIATKLENAAQHNHVRDELALCGIKLTYDWTVHGSVKDCDPARITEVATAELEGVRRADMVVGLLPGGRGTHSELGAAVVLGKPVALYSSVPGHFSNGADTCAFYWAPTVTRFSALDKLIAFVAVGGDPIDCRACAHCFMEPDDDFCCGHADAGQMGTYTRHTRQPGGLCGPEATFFTQHPARKPNGDLGR